MRLQLDRLSCGYGKRPILRSVNASLEPGSFVCMLGRNGSGKSSLLKTLAGILTPLEGQLLAGDRPLTTLSAAERAACLAFVPQAHAPLFSFRVLDLVAMGRTARRTLWQSPTHRDWERAEQALAEIGMEAYSHTSYTTLSGGERQLVMIARALAQEAAILILDEPASSLDFGNQVRVLRCLTALRSRGLSILMATHHPDHALRFASEVWLVQDGGLEVAGSPHKVITPARLEALYDTPFTIAEIHQPGLAPQRTCLPCL